MRIFTTPYKSSEYFEAVALRDRELRRPLGMVLSQDEIDRDCGALHVVGYSDSVLVACASVWNTADESTAQIRQVVVAPGFRGMGLGRQIMKACENHASGLGKTQVILHARNTVVEFYARLDYVISGAPFEEVGIVHRLMVKSLTA